MNEPTHDRVIETLERYFGIGEADAEGLLDELEPIQLAGGEWLFRQGDVADCLYFLLRGRMQVWIGDADDAAGDNASLVGEVTPGESVGEIGLLTGGMRTAGIRAIRDSQLLKLDRAGFEHFAREHPNLVMTLAGSIARRLSERTSLGSSRSRNLGTIAILPLDEGPWQAGFIERLAEELGKRISTLALTSGNLRQLGAPVDANGRHPEISDSLRHWLADRESDHRLLLYVADRGDTSWSRLSVRQADMILLLADSASDAAPRDWEKSLLGTPGATTARRALLLRHPSPDAPISGTGAWLENRDLEFHLHVRSGHPDEIGRPVRMLMGDAVGLVLGGGAARGFAEVGVYRALHEAGVPVDWIGGTSIGGIIGAGIALDRGPDYVYENSREAFVDGKPFGDYTLPLLSLIRGKRMESLTRKHLGGQIEDLPIPFFCVSTLLDNGELFLHEQGSLWRALRATAALPGMLPPAVIERRLVVDGAVVNNLPVDIMRQKPVGRVIAVDVSSRRTFTVDYDALPSPWTLLRNKLLPGRRGDRVPGVVSVLMKSVEIGTAAKVRAHAEDADLLLRPPVHHFGITDIKSFDKIVQAGYEYTREQIAHWMSRGERALPRSS